MYKLHSYLTSTDSSGIIELIDTKVPRYRKRGHPDQWSFESDELVTPRGLPLRLTVWLGGKDRICVDSADTQLLFYGMPTNGAYFQLRLPTDEVLHVTLDEPLGEK